jgi:hypothetical protein
MMRSPVISALVAVTAGPLVAQPNPFKIPQSNVKAQVAYQLTGDQTGTAETAIDGARMVSKSSTTIKMMGKETKSSTWMLITADSMYTVDLDKKQGYVSPNLGPLYARAYDDLDGAGKKRFHSNHEGHGRLHVQGVQRQFFRRGGRQAGR